MRKFVKKCLLLFFLLFCHYLPVSSIDCYVCTSKNGSNPTCEDPFFRNKAVLLQQNCLTGIVNRTGLYRATHCIKLTAHGYGKTYTVRTCSSDQGSGLMDREIVRISHCGYIILKNFDGLSDTDHVFYGCLSACHHDGCNSTDGLKFSQFNALLFLSFYSFLYRF